MDKLQLSAQTREALGKNKVSKLRREKLVPGVVYMKDGNNLTVQMDEKELEKVYSMAGTSHLVELNVSGKVELVLFKEIQKHPFKNRYLHVDFQGVTLGEKLRVMIPVVLEGRDAIRVQPSVLMQHLTEVEVECLPKHIPSEAKVEVSDMQLGQTLVVADLDVAKNDVLTVLAEADAPVATLSEPREEVIEEETAEASDVPTVGETKEAKQE